MVSSVFTSVVFCLKHGEKFLNERECRLYLTSVATDVHISQVKSVN